MRSLLCVESFDLRPSNQDSLVRVIPSCFRLENICVCQVSLLSRCSPRYLTSSVWGSRTLLMCTGDVGNVEQKFISNDDSGRIKESNKNFLWLNLYLMTLSSLYYF
jgi:hypothetical protein